MNVARVILSAVAGLAAALLSFSVIYVRGDLGGVMTVLRARSAARRLAESGAGAAEVEAARANVLALAERFVAPDLATRLVPLELLIGLGVAVFMWWFFERRSAQVQQEGRPDIHERMVLRLAHRMGGRFTLTDLSERSPLSAPQAQATTDRMLERGQLRREGEAFRLA
ncbi:hypothetical protein [Deinococcus gobiensis]|uniref:Uncharacterized protein n=1 Tax=Deinococcus gobiensis (strain DSM 21396 / JCM 16679 / CGMCC 1.7299 / I-0) TaxID=745776 RepID=H8GYG5_DEIGI|nr:hypothetical protein [Deinococcus gobiensis]AFD24818.1 hypothetical protein DGo_CA0891 [Deinococcus gobiensis I-0]